MKQGGQVFGKDYFEELLERIREMRASERRFYQKITDIYAQCSIDYDANSVTAATMRQKIGGFNDKKELQLFLFEETEAEYKTELNLTKKNGVRLKKPTRNAGLGASVEKSESLNSSFQRK